MMHSKKVIGRRFGILTALVAALLMACAGVVLAQGSSSANAGYGNSTVTPSDADQAGVRSGSNVSAAANVPNGDFETGNFRNWNRANQSGSNGKWFVYSGTTSPLSAHTIAAPPQGNFAATTDQTNVGSHVLYRNIKLAAGKKHKLSFYLYYKNFAQTGFSTPHTLDYTVTPNQQYRVDLLKKDADPFSVKNSDILAKIFRTEVGDPNRRAPKILTFNLTPFAGKTVRLRFAEVDNQSYLLASVDRVNVTSKRR